MVQSFYRKEIDFYQHLINYKEMQNHLDHNQASTLKRELLLRNTRLLSFSRDNFSRFRRMLAPLWRSFLDRWDYLLWNEIGSRIFGRRTLLGLDSDGHIMRVRLAKQYLRRSSFFFDMALILKTLPKLFGCKVSS